MTATFNNQPMTWTNHRLKLASNDCINLKAIWKMLILKESHDKKDIKIDNVSFAIFTIFFRRKNLRS